MCSWRKASGAQRGPSTYHNCLATFMKATLQVPPHLDTKPVTFANTERQSIHPLISCLTNFRKEELGQLRHLFSVPALWQNKCRQVKLTPTKPPGILGSEKS